MTELRNSLHCALLEGPLTINAKGIPGNADGSSKASIAYSTGMIERMGGTTEREQVERYI